MNFIKTELEFQFFLAESLEKNFLLLILKFLDPAVGAAGRGALGELAARMGKNSALCNNHFKPFHIRLQHLRNANTSIGILIIF